MDAKLQLDPRLDRIDLIRINKLDVFVFQETVPWF